MYSFFHLIRNIWVRYCAYKMSVNPVTLGYLFSRVIRHIPKVNVGEN